MNRLGLLSILVVLGVALQPIPASAQVNLSPGQLDQLVSRVALYPDPLLAQILTASTFPEQIRHAALWADQHSYLHADQLAAAITEDRLPWDASVLALLPFPTVLDMMTDNSLWTRQLGEAVLAQKVDVMDAVQTERQQANRFGYLQDSPQSHVVVSGSGIIEIMPVDPALIVLPIYDPLIVFGRPRAGMAVGITFGPRIPLGAGFARWGWGTSGFGWANRTIVIDGQPWLRSRENREVYIHPYVVPRQQLGPRMERHELSPRRRLRR